MNDTVLSILMAFSVSFLGTMMGTSYVSRANKKKRVERMHRQYAEDVARIEGNPLTVEQKSLLKERLHLSLSMAKSVPIPSRWIKRNTIEQSTIWVGDDSNRYQEVGGDVEEWENEKSVFFLSGVTAWMILQSVGVNLLSLGILTGYQAFVLWMLYRSSHKQVIPQRPLLIRHFLTLEEYVWLHRHVVHTRDKELIRYTEIPLTTISDEVFKVLKEIFEKARFQEDVRSMFSDLNELEAQQFNTSMQQEEESPRKLSQSLSMRRTLHLKETVDSLLSDGILSSELQHEAERTLRRVEDRLALEKGREASRLKEWQAAQDVALVSAARQQLGMKEIQEKRR